VDLTVGGELAANSGSECYRSFASKSFRLAAGGYDTAAQQIRAKQIRGTSGAAEPTFAVFQRHDVHNTSPAAHIASLLRRMLDSVAAGRLAEKPEAAAKCAANLQILEDTVKTKWHALPEDQRTGIRSFLSNVIISVATSADYAKQKVYLHKLNLVLVQVRTATSTLLHSPANDVFSTW
jgi:hypothetical protein